MSQFKLFRQEALKNQFKSAEFGESVISQPDWLQRYFSGLLVLIVLSFLLASVLPLDAKQQVALSLSPSHFQPLVSATPVIVEQQLVPSGMSVDAGQPVAQLRRFTDATPEGELFNLLATSRGEYFPQAELGATVPALAPIGRILRPEHSAEFQFLLAQADLPLRVGMAVQLQLAGHQLAGQIISVSPDEQHSRTVGIRLLQSVERSLLAPQAPVQMQWTTRRRNIFSLLEQANASR